MKNFLVGVILGKHFQLFFKIYYFVCMQKTFVSKNIIFREYLSKIECGYFQTTLYGEEPEKLSSHEN